MGLLDKWFPKKEESGPFMEHPSGDFETALDAIEDAVSRLRKLPKWDQWITFCAQGQGASPESYHMADIRMLGDKLQFEAEGLQVSEIIKAAGCSPGALTFDGESFSVANASPREVAQILDTVFRQHFKIRPFPDEGDDYAVGAEW